MTTPLPDPDLSRLERLLLDERRSQDEVLQACRVFSANPSHWVVLLPRVRAKVQGQRLEEVLDALLAWEDREIAASARRMGPLR